MLNRTSNRIAVVIAAERRGSDVSHPLFIVGMPRSGTKLLRGLLNRHPRIRIPNTETDFFPFLVRWVSRHGPVQTDAQFARLHQAMSSAPYFAHRKWREPFSAQEWRRWSDRYDASGLFEGFVRYETRTPRGENIWWADKSPAYIRHIGLLLEHFPQARVIHIVRDVRDYCVSIRRAWNKDVRRAAFLWGRDVATAHRYCQAQPGRCIQVRYEGLLSEPESQMRRLCAFLSIDFRDAMVRLRSAEENLGEAAGSVEIVRDNFAKFSQHLSARETADIESLALDTMRLLHYEPVHAQRQRGMGPAEYHVRRLRDAQQLISRSRARRGFLGAVRLHVAHDRLAH